MLVRPSFDNIELLRMELSDPKYGEYHICKAAFLLRDSAYFKTVFTNAVPQEMLQQLATADVHEVVREVWVSNLILTSFHTFSSDSGVLLRFFCRQR